MGINQTLLEKVAAYKPQLNSIKPVRHVPLLFVVGISGAGKNTVQRRLVADYPDTYQYMISHTTRKPRANNGVVEQDGVNYHFIDLVTAERMLDTGEYLEAKCYADNIYGTSTAEIAQAGRAHKIVLNDIEVQGIGEYVQLGMNVKPVFLLPPDYETWWKRLIARYEGKPDQLDLHRRMKTALAELDYALANDFFYIVINDDLEKTVSQVNNIAHDKPVEARPARAITIAKRLAAETESRLATIDMAPLL